MKAFQRLLLQNPPLRNPSSTTRLSSQSAIRTFHEWTNRISSESETQLRILPRSSQSVPRSRPRNHALHNSRQSQSARRQQPHSTAPRRHFSQQSARRQQSPTNPPQPPYPQSASQAAVKDQSLSARFRKLSKEYGYSAFGVYFLLSALDFPFCFAAVRYIGVERVGHAEHVIVEKVKAVIPEGVKEGWRTVKGSVMDSFKGEEEAKAVGGGKDASTAAAAAAASQSVTPGVPGEAYAEVVGDTHGVVVAEKENAGDNASTLFLTSSLETFPPPNCYRTRIALCWSHRKPPLELFLPPTLSIPNILILILTNVFFSRYMDPTSPRLRNPQIIHLHPRPPDRSRHA